MVVHLTLDTKDLAETYDGKDVSPYTSGRILIEKLGVKPGDSILDVGCGTGRLGRHVLDITSNIGQFRGIDPMAERIKIAKEKNEHSNAAFQIGVAEDLGSVADNSMDIVYLNWVFHWVLDKEKALQELVRVLKPGGKSGITFPPKELSSITGVNWIIDSVLRREPYVKLVRSEEATHYLHNLTTTDLIEMITKAGLKIQDVHIKLAKRHFQSARDVIDSHEAGLFGNFLKHVPASLRQQAKIDIESEFEKYQTQDGLQFDYYTVYAIAQKEES